VQYRQTDTDPGRVEPTIDKRVACVALDSWQGMAAGKVATAQ